MRERERARERERVCVCVEVACRDRESACERECVCVRERVCVCERECVRECVHDICVHAVCIACMHVYKHTHTLPPQTDTPAQVVTRRTNMPYWLQKRNDIYKVLDVMKGENRIFFFPFLFNFARS